jgi:hypothetical protein
MFAPNLCMSLSRAMPQFPILAANAIPSFFCHPLMFLHGMINWTGSVEDGDDGKPSNAKHHL